MPKRPNFQNFWTRLYCAHVLLRRAGEEKGRGRGEGTGEQEKEKTFAQYKQI
jgi:hypothetical protein